MYGEVPPVADAVAVPVACPLHNRFTEETVTIGLFELFTIIVAVCVQPSELVTKTVYVPLPSPVAVCAV